jgi:hypothetical protein
MKRSRFFPRGGFVSTLGLRSSCAMIARRSFAPTQSTISEKRPFLESERLRESPVAAPIWLCHNVVRLQKGAGGGYRTTCTFQRLCLMLNAQQDCFCNGRKARDCRIGRHPTTVSKQGKGSRYAKSSNFLKMGPEPGEADCDDGRTCRQHLFAYMTRNTSLAS